MNKQNQIDYRCKALIGAGGHAREVRAQMGCPKLPMFVDDSYYRENSDGILPLSLFDPKIYEVLVCIAQPGLRRNLVERLPACTRFFSFVHPTALILDEISIPPGTFIGLQCVLTTNISMGKHVLLNRGNHIGHDCQLGDYFSAMPCAVIGGNVTVGNEVYLGSCSNVREKIRIADRVVVGMNSAVVSHLLDVGTYVGVPAKLLKKRDDRIKT